MKLFKNRIDAGQKLAEKLKELELNDNAIFALPRGGVPVASELARQMGKRWDILLVKKIGAPNHPEFAIGALCEDYQPVWNEEVISLVSLKDRELAELVESSKLAIQKQYEMWRQGFVEVPLCGQDVIIVDDGLSTGLTMQAAIQFLRKKSVGKIIVAVPVSPRSTIDSLRPLFDDVLCLETPEHFLSVGEWYEDFSEVSSEEITSLLHSRLSGSDGFNPGYASGSMGR